ncbi:MAG: hypothetical protein AMJ43_07805 [Coxiella sp. DG_40]|nr:MAG: hypothetical protein AMJ43_07805 [Coxiella sp. DG_40]
MNHLIETVKEDLKIYEGFKPYVYLCPAGLKTIGYGHNIESSPLTINGIRLDKDYIIDGKHVITREEAEEVLEDDIKNSEDDSRRLFSDFYDYPLNVRYSIISMVYQLGMPTVGNFRNMCAAIKNRKWKVACYEALNSKWHLQDTPERSLKVAFKFLDAID